MKDKNFADHERRPEEPSENERYYQSWLEEQEQKKRKKKKKERAEAARNIFKIGLAPIPRGQSMAEERARKFVAQPWFGAPLTTDYTPSQLTPIIPTPETSQPQGNTPTPTTDSKPPQEQTRDPKAKDDQNQNKEKPPEPQQTAQANPNEIAPDPNKPKPTPAEGLNNPEVMGRFVGDMQTLQGNWQSLTPDRRQAALTEIANQALQSAGVSRIREVIPGQLSPDSQGKFNSKTFEINVAQELLNKPKLSKEEMSRLTNALYHETRYAEQSFRIAQMLASRPPNGQPRTAEQISQEMRIPLGVAERALEAVQTQALTPEQLDQSRKWHDNLYGSGAKDRPMIMGRLGDVQLTSNSLNQKLLAAQEVYERAVQENAPQADRKRLYNQVEATRQQVEDYRLGKEFTQAYNDYKIQPTVADASIIGNGAEALYRQREGLERIQRRSELPGDTPWV